MSWLSTLKKNWWLKTLILSLSSVGGLGYLPYAPGTYATLAAVPLWWFLNKHLSTGGFGSVVILLTLLAIGVSALAEMIYQAHDRQEIVIDEVVGLLVTVIGIPFKPETALLAFLLFRLLDIFKPSFIGVLDKKFAGGLGVVLDDVAAGLTGLLVLHLSLPWLERWSFISGIFLR